MNNFLRNTLKVLLKSVRRCRPSPIDSTLDKKTKSSMSDYSSISEKSAPPPIPSESCNQSLSLPDSEKKEDFTDLSNEDNVLCDLKPVFLQEPLEQSAPIKKKLSKTRSSQEKHSSSLPSDGKAGRCRTVKIRKKQAHKNKKTKSTNVNSPVLKLLGDGYCIHAQSHVAPNPVLVERPHIKDLNIITDEGVGEQITGAPFTDEREVVIGIDFGTSSVKVVMGDGALGKAYAVPFTDEVGLGSYLLPSRVWRHDDGEYSLSEKGKPLRNLKLQLIDEECSLENFSNGVAFLGLIIRHARGWIFKEHLDIYRKTKIFWKVTLGLPAENYDNDQLVERFKKIAAAAWKISLIPGEGGIPSKVVSKVCSTIQETTLNHLHEQPGLDSLDIDVVPELSAQIYGFMTSTKFDSKAKNIFMIVDIGAGTIDSSVFYVKRGKAKALSFVFYGHAVELNGVVNLHNSRIEWIRSAFKELGFLSDNTDSLNIMQLPTDFVTAIPESIDEYFEGVNFTFTEDKKSPDSVFFKDKVKKQVFVKTLAASRKYFESPQFSSGMPVFLCGGGSRMKLYKNIEKELVINSKNASWASYSFRKLEVPDILIAPGLPRDEFDRLSVAFGLSFVRVGEFARGTEVPPEKPAIFDYEELFISSDMV